MKERVWALEAIQQHPLKWIVMTHLEWEGKARNKLVGEVYAIVDEFDEAMDMADSLGDGYGEVSFFEGYDPRPQIGGLFIQSCRS